MSRSGIRRKHTADAIQHAEYRVRRHPLTRRAHLAEQTGAPRIMHTRKYIRAHMSACQRRIRTRGGQVGPASRPGAFRRGVGPKCGSFLLECGCVLCRITLAYSLLGLTPVRVLPIAWGTMSWLMLSTILLPLLSIGTQINNDTLTLWVKCYNGISVHFADPSVIVLIIPREWHPLGAVARIGSAPSFLVIALRTPTVISGAVAKD